MSLPNSRILDPNYYNGISSPLTFDKVFDEKYRSVHSVAALAATTPTTITTSHEYRNNTKLGLTVHGALVRVERTLTTLAGVRVPISAQIVFKRPVDAVVTSDEMKSMVGYAAHGCVGDAIMDQLINGEV